MNAQREGTAAPRDDAARMGCARVRGVVSDPAAWVWAVVALLALLPLAEALAGA